MAESQNQSESGCGWALLIVVAVGLCFIPFVGLPIALVLIFGAIFGNFLRSKLADAEKLPGEPKSPAAPGDRESGRDDDGVASPS